MILLGGVLLGCEGKERVLPSPLRGALEDAIVSATNAALREEDINTPQSIVFVVNTVFELLADHRRSKINYDVLLPLLVEIGYFADQGLQQGFWLSMIDTDVVEIAGRKFSWHAGSKSFAVVKNISARPLVASLGPLARLTAHAIENTRDSRIILSISERVAEFSRTLLVSWRQNKLSEIDRSEEEVFLDSVTIRTTLPVLWQLLRLSFFSTLITIRSIVGRTLDDSLLSLDSTASSIGVQCLHILRNFYFVSHRLGQTSSSQYVFVEHAAIDILAQSPDQAETFLLSIKPAQLGQIPTSPIERVLDLYFLNLAEHFPLIISSELSDRILVPATLPYLAPGNHNLLELFEAAHSLILSVFASPRSAELAAQHLSFYIDALFRAFPQNLSARQFRLAVKTLVRIASPPAPLAASQPLLSLILLDMVYDRAYAASPRPLATTSTDKSEVLSEQAALIMALIDCLPLIPVKDILEWLPFTSAIMDKIEDPGMKAACHRRFWECLSGGEMDVHRASICVAWWNNRGGREQILYGESPEDNEEYMMSGAFPIEHENKL